MPQPPLTHHSPGLDPTGGDGLYTDLDGITQNGNVWPSESDIPNFYSTVKDYYGHILSLARHLSRLFALSLDLPESHFDEMMTHPGGIARLLYYPPSKDPKPLDPERKDDEVGLGAHSDYECFTILLCSSAPGLEVLSPEDSWVPLAAVDGGFVSLVISLALSSTGLPYPCFSQIAATVAGDGQTVYFLSSHFPSIHCA